MSKGLKIFFILLILLLVIIAIWFKSKNGENIHYKTAEPKIANIINKKYISGIIIPSREINLMPQLSGIIEDIYVKPGDKVKIGDKIAKVKLIASPMVVENAERSLNIAELSYNLYEKEYNRYKVLYKKGFVSDSEFELVENNWMSSQEELNSAKKQLHIAKKGYARGEKLISNIVTSTVEGTVLELPLKIGASVIEKNTFGKGTVIATIADMNNLIFKGKVNENDLIYIHENINFKVSVNALKNKSFNTVMTEISLKGKNENGIVKFDFEGQLDVNEIDSLPTRSGYTGIAEIILEEVNSVLTIEEKNIYFRNDSAIVEILLNGSFKERYISLGVSDGINAEIKEGITLNDKIKIQD